MNDHAPAAATTLKKKKAVAKRTKPGLMKDLMSEERVRFGRKTR